MKRYIVGIRITACICAALGWWGVLYPELTMTPDTYRVVDESGSVQTESKVVEWDFDSDIYRQILNTDPGRLRFRSRLLQSAAEVLGKAD